MSTPPTTLIGYVTAYRDAVKGIEQSREQYAAEAREIELIHPAIKRSQSTAWERHCARVHALRATMLTAQAGMFHELEKIEMTMTPTHKAVA
jgi:hypothetical protein